jgi:hypothetical protein
VLVADAAVSSLHPGLEVGDRSVRARKKLLAGLGTVLGAATVVVAVLGEHAVGLQPVGVYDRAGRRRGLGERHQRGAQGIGQDSQAQSARALPPDLDRDPAQRLLAALAAAFEPLLVPADIELVDLDLLAQQGALGRDHRPAQLLQDQPRGLIPREAELALQLLGGDPGVMGGDQIGRPEPQPQRHARAVHHGARRHRRLAPTRGAHPQVPARLAANAILTAPRATKSARPARREQVLPARILGRKALLELQDRSRVRGSRHPAKLGHAPDGANRIRITGVVSQIGSQAIIRLVKPVAPDLAAGNAQSPRVAILG